VDKQIEIRATFDSDTKRMHRFLIDNDQEVTGSIYFRKGMKIPESIKVILKTKADDKL
jgi:hypothetical protein